MAYTHLYECSELRLSEYVYFNSGSADISDLIILSPEKLAQMEQDSIALERSIYDKILEAVGDWKKQASKTLNYKRAQEYLKVPPVSHTSNEWTVNQYGHHEMSNMVYCFSWREYERTSYDRTLEKSIPVAWELSWSVTFNTTRKPDYTDHGRKIAGQERKVFKDRAAMEKYLQGRIAAYAHLFTEISPPIPEEARRRFCVNGVLLPGYTVETPITTQPNPDTVDDLLSYLDDDDMSNLLRPEEQKPPAEDPPPKPAPKKAPAHKHRRLDPAR